MAVMLRRGLGKRRWEWEPQTDRIPLPSQVSYFWMAVNSPQLRVLLEVVGSAKRCTHRHVKYGVGKDDMK